MMNLRNRIPLLALGFLVALSVAVFALFLSTRGARARAAALPVLGQVQGFQFTNQLGQAFSTTALAGRTWVADLIFTRCPGPCVDMTRNLSALQQRTTSAQLALVTLTADPEHDTVGVLKSYAERFGALPGRWQFLTGPKGEINRVAMKQLLLAVEEKPEEARESADDLFLHSTKWVLVDGRGRLRGVYEGTEPESVEAVLRDLRRLEREPSGTSSGSL